MTLGADDLSWISGLTGDNFLSVYDVVWDVRNELQLSDHAVIPVFQRKVKFPAMLPVVTPGWVDHYCARRAKAVKFLKRKGVIRDFKHRRGDHRWDGEYQLCVDEERFKAVAGTMTTEFKRRRSDESDLAKSTQADDTSFRALLHPVVIKSSYKHFADGHLREAVLNAVIGLFDFIRERSGSAKDGPSLIGEVFSTSKPLLILSEMESESGLNDQKGFIQILQGAYLGIRNPKAHTLAHDLTKHKAMQYLVFVSLLARRVDEAKEP